MFNSIFHITFNNQEVLVFGNLSSRPGGPLMKRSNLVVALAVLSLAAAAHAADQYAVTYDRNVVVTMRDGVKLKADIYRPNVDGKFPVLLQRTPYNKDNGVEFGIK